MAAMNICTGYNLAYNTSFYSDCEMVSEPLVVGGTYKNETILEVEDFVQPKESGEEHTCQMITTDHYHEIVIVME